MLSKVLSFSSLLRLTPSSVRLRPRLYSSAGSGTTPLPDRVSIRFTSTSPSFVRPADVTRDKIKDAVDRQIQNRTSLMTPEDRWRERSKKALESAGRTPPAHTYTGIIFLFCFHYPLTPSKGRTVHIKAEGDLATAYRQLDAILQRNKVRATLRMTERHEKPGVKRRRLRSQRWRKRFADEVCSLHSKLYATC